MTGVLPAVLKIAKVVPVLKKGLKLEYGNYRPISQLLNLEKILKGLCIKDWIPFSITVALFITCSLDLDNILHLMP